MHILLLISVVKKKKKKRRPKKYVSQGVWFFFSGCKRSFLFVSFKPVGMDCEGRGFIFSRKKKNGTSLEGWGGREPRLGLNRNSSLTVEKQWGGGGEGSGGK